MKKESKLLLKKAVDSLILSIEHFNRPWDRGRVEAVMIFLDHAFEMLLKAAIIHRGGKIREPRARETISLKACIRKSLSDAKIKFLSEDQAILLRAINSLRDGVQHYFNIISEQTIYIHAQAGLTLFKDLLKEVFEKDLHVELPDRVLPISTTAPSDLAMLFDNEIDEIERLLQPGSRRGLEAKAKLRTLSIIERAIQGEENQPSQNELQKINKAIREGISWEEIFPGVASINITATGYGPSIDLRISTKEGSPFQLVPEGTPGATVVGYRRVNELGFYNLGLNKLAEKVGLTSPRTSAMAWYLGFKKDKDCYKEITIGKSVFKQYSQKAIKKISDALEKVSIDDIWGKYKKWKKERDTK